MSTASAAPDLKSTAQPLRLKLMSFAAICALLSVSFVFRLLWLDRLPGINGDEGWYGVQVARMLSGKRWSLLTPSNLPINPLLFLTEAGVLLLCEPSFAVLRFPIAIWACVGLVLTYYLHRWLYCNSTEALLAATFTACLPAHLAYSRFCWDASFGLVSLPIVLYSTLRIASHSGTVGAWACLVGGATLSVWVHATNGVFLLACFLVLAWNWLKPLCQAVFATAVGRCTAAGLALISIVLWFVCRWDSAIWYMSWGDTWLAGRGASGWRAFATAVDLLTGPRVYEYVAGVPRPPWIGVLYVASLIAGAAVSTLLWCNGQGADRALIAIVAVLMVLLLLPAVSDRLRLGELSYERYLLYFVPLGAALFVRGTHVFGRGQNRSGSEVAPAHTPNPLAWSAYIPTILTLGCAAFFLVQFWFCYFQPLRQDRYGERMRGTYYQTFRTGPIEPKAAAAQTIMRQAAGATNYTVYAQDWSIRWPIEYLIEGRCEVHEPPVRLEPGTKVFVVGYGGDSFLRDVSRDIHSRGWDVSEEVFLGSTGRPLVSLLTTRNGRD